MDLERRRTTGAASQDTSGLRSNTLALDDLSEELERGIKETQKLQEEVENATKFTLEKFGCTDGHVYAPSWDSSHLQAAGQRDVSPTTRKEASAPHEQGMESLQTSFQQVQMERRTDSRRQVDQMEKMLSLLEELQAIKRSGDQNLREAQNETWQLNKNVEALEGNIKKWCQTLLSHEKTVSSTIASDRQTESHLQLAEHVNSDDLSGGEIDQKMAPLVASLGQEVAMLNHKLRSSKESGARISTKLDLLMRSLYQVSEEEVQTPGGEQGATEEEKSQEAMQTHLAADPQRVEAQDPEKQQLAAQLEVQHRRLLAITKAHGELQQLHSCTTEEHKGIVLRLQGRMDRVQTELDRVKRTLRTLEGADCHGLRAALDMQKEITAGRRQTDTLQARVRQLEETLKKLNQERFYQDVENRRQVRQLAFVEQEKRQLAHQLDAVCSKDKHLRERIGELEAILHKTAESFANCQDFIQLKEQEFFRLKVKHILDLKEFQGPNVTPPELDSPTLNALGDLHPSAQDACNAQIKERRESLAPGRLGALSQNPGGGPPTDNGAAPGRRSPPARAHRPAFIEEVKAHKAAHRPKTYHGEPHSPKKTAEPGPLGDSHMRSALASATKNTLSPPRRLLSGRRSPVHALLTSDPAHS
ncbi:coiled-coil domain-containing protein 158-like [Nerophis ophidion]|uniref:coiled-coil domain-containing protein 158-like n=1 Tax=Nerophis ophidion TaxID=159077 RepID=UPI002AE013AD|nr:coiled-coil domain-containing protein 158-like [Nerophis ophidion]